MDQDRTYRAGEAGTIAGVNPNLQHNWRNRGLLPAGNGEKVKFTLREVCHLRVLRALSEAGVPLPVAALAATPTDVATATLAEATFARINGLSYSRDHLMTVAASGSEPRVVSSASTLKELQPFSALIVIDLDKLADEMADKIELIGLDRRVAAVDADMAKRGD